MHIKMKLDGNKMVSVNCYGKFNLRLSDLATCEVLNNNSIKKINHILQYFMLLSKI